MKNTFDFLTEYQYYGRRPSNILKEDEIDDALGLGDMTPQDATAAMGAAEQQPQDQAAAPQGEMPAEPQTAVQPNENAVQIDVTQLVLKQDEINKTVQDVLSKLGDLVKGNENLKSELDKKLQNMEVKSVETEKRMADELQKRVPTPVEKLQLQSLHSFPYNVKLTDYWVPTEEDKYKYAVANVKTNMNDDPTFNVNVKNLPNIQKEPEEYTLRASDIMKGYNETMVKNSF